MTRPTLTHPTGPRTWADVLCALYREWGDRSPEERSAAVRAARDLWVIVRRVRRDA